MHFEKHFQGRERGAANRVVGSNMSGGIQGGPQQFQNPQDYQRGQQNPQQQNQPGYQQNMGYQQQQGPPGYQQNFPQQQQQQSQYGQQNQGPPMQGPQTSKPIRGIPAVIPTAQKPPDQSQQQQQQQQQQSTGPNLMQKFTEMAGASAGGDILSKGKELIFMKFGLGK